MSSIINERFKELVTSSGKTRQEIAEQIGCDASTVTKHFGGSREITSDFLVKYAEYFCVSTDYLVGLTDAKTNDKGLQFVCDFLGTDEDMVSTLKELITEVKEIYSENYFKKMLSSLYFKEWLLCIFQSWHTRKLLVCECIEETSKAEELANKTGEELYKKFGAFYQSSGKDEIDRLATDIELSEYKAQKLLNAIFCCNDGDFDLII